MVHAGTLILGLHCAFCDRVLTLSLWKGGHGWILRTASDYQGVLQAILRKNRTYVHQAPRIQAGG